MKFVTGSKPKGRGDRASPDGAPINALHRRDHHHLAVVLKISLLLCSHFSPPNAMIVKYAP